MGGGGRQPFGSFPVVQYGERPVRWAHRKAAATALAAKAHATSAALAAATALAAKAHATATTAFAAAAAATSAALAAATALAATAYAATAATAYATEATTLAGDLAGDLAAAATTALSAATATAHAAAAALAATALAAAAAAAFAVAAAAATALAATTAATHALAAVTVALATTHSWTCDRRGARWRRCPRAASLGALLPGCLQSLRHRFCRLCRIRIRRPPSRVRCRRGCESQPLPLALALLYTRLVGFVGFVAHLYARHAHAHDGAQRHL